jgi:hypothetical protein
MVILETTLCGAMAANIQLRLKDRFVVGFMLVEMGRTLDSPDVVQHVGGKWG